MFREKCTPRCFKNKRGAQQQHQTQFERFSRTHKSKYRELKQLLSTI